MKKINILTCCLLFFIAATCAVKGDQVRIQGSIEVPEGADYSLSLKVGEEWIAIAPDSTGGHFSLELKCDSSDIVILAGIIGTGEDKWPFTQPLFIVPGKDVGVELKAEKEGMDIKIVGEDDNNNALRAYQQYYWTHARALWMESPQPSKAGEFLQAFNEKAGEVISMYHPDDKVKQYLTIFGYLEYLKGVEQLPYIYRNNSNGELPTNLRQAVVTPDKMLDNSMAMVFADGTRQVISTYLAAAAAEEPEEQIRLLKEKFTNPLVVNMMLRNVLEGYLHSSETTQSFEDRLARFEKMCTVLPEGGEELVEMFRAKKYSIEGAGLPDAVIEDVNGKQYKLSDFKGNYLYVDLWASWCVPCCKEVPYLQKMEKQVKNDKLKFISISLDKDKEDWKKRMKQLGMEGNQFVVVGDELVNMLSIKGIPHFLIYSKEGKLIQYKATAPSDGDALKNLLEELK